MNLLWVVRRRNPGGHPGFQTAGRNVRCLLSKQGRLRKWDTGGSSITGIRVRHVESAMSTRNAVRLAVGYRLQGRRHIRVGDIDLGGDTIYMMFRAFSRDEVTKGVRTIEGKGTGANSGLLRAQHADQSAHQSVPHSLVLRLEGT